MKWSSSSWYYHNTEILSVVDGIVVSACQMLKNAHKEMVPQFFPPPRPLQSPVSFQVCKEDEEYSHVYTLIWLTILLKVPYIWA